MWGIILCVCNSTMWHNTVWKSAICYSMTRIIAQKTLVNRQGLPTSMTRLCARWSFRARWHWAPCAFNLQNTVTCFAKGKGLPSSATHQRCGYSILATPSSFHETLLKVGLPFTLIWKPAQTCRQISWEVTLERWEVTLGTLISWYFCMYTNIWEY